MFRKRIEGILHIIERKHRLEVRVKSVEDPTHNRHGSGKASGAAAAGDGTASQAAEKEEEDPFKKYKGKAYEKLEPITCIHHLMEVMR